MRVRRMRSRMLILIFLGFVTTAIAQQKAPAPDRSFVQSLVTGTPPPVSAQPPEHLLYRFGMTYYTFNEQGVLTGTTPMEAQLTFHPADGSVEWTSMVVNTSPAPGQPQAAPQHQAYMEGLRYTRADADKMFTSGFLNKFPPGTEQERNLVLDLEMFDSFVHNYTDKLRLSQPFEGPSGQVPLGPDSSFENTKVILTWTGITRRNGEDCLVVHYESLRNHFQITSGPIKVTARSDYSGDMWISAQTRQARVWNAIRRSKRHHPPQPHQHSTDPNPKNRRARAKIRAIALHKYSVGAGLGREADRPRPALQRFPLRTDRSRTPSLW